MFATATKPSTDKPVTIAAGDVFMLSTEGRRRLTPELWFGGPNHTPAAGDRGILAVVTAEKVAQLPGDALLAWGPELPVKA